MDLTTASRDDFTPLLEQRFIAQDNDNIELTLVRVDPLPKHQQSARAPFALVFRASANKLLEQGIYQLHNSTAGTLSIFLVPIEQIEDTCLYEAVFN